MNVKDGMMLLVLASLWGASFLFMRIGSPALGPVVLIELRVLLAGLTLLVFAAVTRHRIHILHKWWQYLVLGAANAAVPFTLIAYAELRLAPGLAAVLNATTPLFTMLVAWLWVRDPFTPRKLLGMAIGIMGVGILVGWKDGSGLPISALWSLLAAACYGAAGVFASRAFRGEKPLDMAIGQQLGAALLWLPLSLSMLPRTMPAPAVICSVLGLAVLCTAVAYLLYFSLIHTVGPVKTLLVTFLVPIFGVIWGALFLGEPITVRLLGGLAVILSSIALVVNLRRERTAVSAASNQDVS